MLNYEDSNYVNINHTVDDVISSYMESLDNSERKELKEELYYNISFNKDFKQAVAEMAIMVEAVLKNKFDVLEKNLNKFVFNFQSEHPFTRKMRISLLDNSFNNEIFSILFQLDLEHVSYKINLLKKYLSRPLLITNDDIVQRLKEYNEFYNLNEPS